MRENHDPINLKIESLKEIPLVNIIIPAWKEGDLFKKCLSSIKALKYPNLKIIINAGGSEETLKIAKSFKKYRETIIIFQKEGGGKIKAINDALSYTLEGIICLIDADVYLTDQTFLKTIYPIINFGESIVISKLKPADSQIRSNLTKYIFINRNIRFKFKFRRYDKQELSQHICLRSDVIKSIGKFTEKRLYGDTKSMANELTAKGYKIYQLVNQETESYNFPDKIMDYIPQNIRWIENAFFYKIKHGKKTPIMKLIILAMFSSYLVIFPFLTFINFSFLIVGLFFLYNSYLKKIRKILFFRITFSKKYYGRFSLVFYFKILLYTYIDAIINIYILFELIFFRDKKFKKRKNIA